jgi:hypothetical protein
VFWQADTGNHMRRTQYSLILVSLFLFGGACSSIETRSKFVAPQTTATVASFFKALDDFKKTDQVFPEKYSSTNWRNYFLPASAEQLINQGNLALPILRQLNNSTNDEQSIFAEACIEIISAKSIQVSGHFMSHQGGVEMVHYVISN